MLAWAGSVGPCAHCCQSSACHYGWGTSVSSSACQHDRHRAGVELHAHCCQRSACRQGGCPCDPPLACQRPAWLPHPPACAWEGKRCAWDSAWQTGAQAAWPCALAARLCGCRYGCACGLPAHLQGHRCGLEPGGCCQRWVGEACEPGQGIEGGAARYSTDPASRDRHVTGSSLAPAGQFSTDEPQDQVRLPDMHLLEGEVGVPVCAAELWCQHCYTDIILIVCPGYVTWVACLWLACHEGLWNRSHFDCMWLACQRGLWNRSDSSGSRVRSWTAPASAGGGVGASTLTLTGSGVSDLERWGSGSGIALGSSAAAGAHRVGVELCQLRTPLEHIKPLQVHSH